MEMPICREDKIRLEAIVTGLRKARKIVEENLENEKEKQTLTEIIDRKIEEVQRIIAIMNEDYTDQRMSDVYSMLETRAPQQE
jgi:lambda repressor-like predicted transcriptional regulator